MRLTLVDFILMVEEDITRKMFPLSDKREDTYIAGLSMGGYGTLRNGIVYSETFSHIAGLSSAVHLFDKDAQHIGGEDTIFGDIDKAVLTNVNPKVAFDELIAEKCKMHKFYMSCGTEDDLITAGKDLRDYLISKGADVTWDEEKGGHDWDFWDSQIKKVLEWLPLDNDINGLGSGNVKIGDD